MIWFGGGLRTEVDTRRYLYVSATTVCVDVGVAIVAATGSYTYAVSTAAYRKEWSPCCKCSSSSSVMKTAS